MERKIGEIFEYNGEWYQCVEQPKDYKGEVCKICSFSGIGNCELDKCSETYRADKKSVIFKKLEKVGEPFTDYCPSGRIICFQRYKCYQKPIYTGNFICWADDINISIEIKQNKEDMEEKYSELTGIVHEYMEKDMTYKDFKEAIDYWVDDYIANKSVNNSNLKPFSLEAAKAGKPVCTRDGFKARIICFDLKNQGYPIVAAIEKDSSETILSYTINGEIVKGAYKSPKDLMMLPEKKEGWVNIDKGGSGKIAVSSPYSTKEEAIHNDNETTIDTIKISWEE